MIGAGAVVIQNIEEIGTYVGVPAERVEIMKKLVNVNYRGVVHRRCVNIFTPVFLNNNFRRTVQ